MSTRKYPELQHTNHAIRIPYITVWLLLPSRKHEVKGALCYTAIHIFVFDQWPPFVLNSFITAEYIFVHVQYERQSHNSNTFCHSQL